MLSACLLALGGLGTMGLPPALAQEDVVAQRKQLMKNIGSHMEAIKAVVDASGPSGSIAPRAEEIHRSFANLPALFPPGTTENTKARPEVWSERAGFERAAANASQAAATLASTAASGDGAATASAFREMGGACGACHRNYRAR
ncbi:cytochrome c [Roseomonas marmotae]|uniref:c-type cytochrome n=1 Tax=Roseomonas marmotae TaxID=2768161 RepID=UPI001AD7D4DB|nr:cytochrome c [Roseomonas marmotae]QTI80216.1 cytochrome c [Roseomonas marmotae]